MISWLHDAMAAHPFWGVVVICLLLAAANFSKHQRMPNGRQDPIDNIFSWLAFFSACGLIICWIGG